MEVELKKSLLKGQPAESLFILALCAFGIQERHRIVPDDRKAWDAWAAKLPPDIAEEVRLSWDEGERLAAEGMRVEEIRVEPATTSLLKQQPIVVGVTDALSLLGRPLRVILENGRNDRAFVLAFASAASYEKLKQAEDAGWLVFETGGGIGELKARTTSAVSDARHAPMDVLRTMYLCDSDSKEPGKPSPDALVVKQSLTKLEKFFKRGERYFGQALTRRAAENYAPAEAVFKWVLGEYTAKGNDDSWRLIRQAAEAPERERLAKGPGTAGTPRRRLLAAIALRELARSSSEVHGVFDMKEGRGSDEKHRKTADAVWSRLDTFQQAVLANGFGESFSAQFYRKQKYLHDETGEVAGFIETILERI